MDLQLKGKRALVTGSTGGIGEVIAKVLAREGARVLVHGRRDAEAKRVVSDIEKAGGSAIAVLGDLATDEGAKQALDGVEKSGGVDILVNNAGTWDGRAWFEVEPAEWGALYNANVVASVRMIKALAPAMKKAGWGRIIQMASGVATAPPPGREPHYAATKAALVNLTVGLGMEMLGSGVTVNAVSPGIVLTPVIEGAFPRPRAAARLGERLGRHRAPRHDGGLPHAERADGTARRHRQPHRVRGEPSRWIHPRDEPPRGRRLRRLGDVISVLGVAGFDLPHDHGDGGRFDPGLAHERSGSLDVVGVDRVEEVLDAADRRELLEHQRPLEVGLVHRAS